jgi:hypothetical protein
VSNKRRARAVTAGHVAATYAGTDTARLVGTKDIGGRVHELWTLNGTLFVVPLGMPCDPPGVSEAFAIRKAATLTGRCPNCDAVVGATAGIPDVDLPYVGAVHDGTCPATDANLTRMLHGT